jgi:YfiH family protein
VIRWDVPAPFIVAFTTREGGVSTGPFSSLNLGSKGDRPLRVSENRRLACEALGLDSARLAVNSQRHGTRTREAEPGVERTGDALWTDEAELPLLVTTADCLPIAIMTRGGPKPRLAVVHAGWRGLAAGVVEAATESLGTGEKEAVIGPAIGACCYEVGPEVSECFDEDLTRGRMLDLRAAGTRALKAAGVRKVGQVELCTSCHPELFFSHRRDGARRGVQGVIGALAG